MSAAPLAAARPLLDVLGARWRVGVAVAGVAWDGVTGLAGFALDDGTVALAHPVWKGAPGLRPRGGGGVELVPGTEAPPPAARVKAHQNACLSVCADPDGGFLTGGADGRVTCVQATGEVRAIAHLDRAVALVAAGPGHWRACSAGRDVRRLGGAAAHVTVAATVAALSVDPTGARLGIAHDGGVTLWAGGDTPRVLAAPGNHGDLSWSGDGTLLASATPEGALHLWRWPEASHSVIDAGGPVGGLGVLATGAALVAGVGGRVLCWSGPTSEATTCGVANQSAVTRVACHPRRALVAAGYANGTVALCQPGSSGLLFLRAAGEGSVSALAFAPTGDSLAIGTNGGEVAVLALPDLLFREQAKRQ